MKLYNKNQKAVERRTRALARLINNDLPYYERRLTTLEEEGTKHPDYQKERIQGVKNQIGRIEREIQTLKSRI